MRRHFEGVILGTAVGDAIGLPREGLSRRRGRKMFGEAPLRHRLVFGRGMTSDDTEHTCMAAQSLIASRGDAEKFSRSMAWRLRGWILSIPAGVGLATLRACVKLWLGFPAHRSGVWSAGNGPAMRAAVFGVWAFDDLSLLRRLVSASTSLTHRDPAAEHGALAVALAAACAVRRPASDAFGEIYVDLLREVVPESQTRALVEEACRAAADPAVTFAGYLHSCRLDRGISGYVNHTVPAAIFCWLRWPSDYRRAVEEIVLAGGDTDTTGAIVGALVGISAGSGAIPAEWLDGLIEWPRSVAWMRRLACRLAEARTSEQPVLPSVWPALLVRNIFFLIVVLSHGFRRLAPPY